MDRQVLCAANSYIKKFYLDPAFGLLPGAVKQELELICVSFTEDIGGILLMEFNEQGSLCLKTMADDGDYLFDEVGAELKIKEMTVRHAELFAQLELLQLSLAQCRTGGARPQD